MLSDMMMLLRDTAIKGMPGGGSTVGSGFGS